MAIDQGRIDHLTAALRGREGALYALLDTARDERILEILRASSEERESLYEGVTAALLSEYAPYLVRLPEGSPLLPALLAEGWGKSWGVFLTSGARFGDVRRHLRKLLYARTEADKTLYFRFYDPRVLRVFLPTCAPRQVAMLFNEVSAYLVEGRPADTLLAFTPGGSAVLEARISVHDGASPQTPAQLVHDGASPQTPAQLVHDGASPQTPAQPLGGAAVAASQRQPL